MVLSEATINKKEHNGQIKLNGEVQECTVSVS